MGKRPPCVLYQSFLVLSVFVHDAPNKGTHPPVMHLTSLESHHSRDLREAPSLAATAHGTLFVPLQRSACDWTQVSLMLLPVMAFGADAPHRPRKSRVAHRFRRRQKEGKGCAVLFGFQRTPEAMKKPPHFFSRKSKGATTKFFNFLKVF